MSCDNLQEPPITEIDFKTIKSNRLECIATNIVYGEYQRNSEQNKDLLGENYREALNFLDLQLYFTEEDFDRIIQQALKILYNVEDTNNG